jgi:hypothetical protein
VHPEKRLPWAGAVVTALAAVFFPRIQGIRDGDGSWWSLLWFVIPQDLEGVVLVPLVIVLTFALFALVGGWAWRAPGRPAKAGLWCAIVGLVSVVLFWLSAPIIFGGLAATLGVEGRRRRETEGRGTLAAAAIVIGAVAFAVGAAIWVFSEELSI